MAALHVLDTRYATQLNSLGQRIIEPFGDQERLGVLRTGGFVSATVGNNGAWNPYTELLLDHELDNNMTGPLDDRTSVLWRTIWLACWGPASASRWNTSVQKAGMMRANVTTFWLLQ